MEERKVVEYSFSQGYRVPWLEEILSEFEIETKECWYSNEDDDWLFQPRYVFEEPEYPDLYSICYTCLPESNNFAHEFAEILIDAMMQTTGYLEGCLKQEIDNKKEDTE